MLFLVGLVVVLVVPFIRPISTAVAQAVRAQKLQRQQLARLDSPPSLSRAWVSDQKIRPLRQFGEPPRQSYLIEFDLPDGQHLTLEVDPQTYTEVVTSDVGTLTWRGDQFLGFQREAPR